MTINILCGQCHNAYKSVNVIMKHTGRIATTETNYRSQYECSQCGNKIIIEAKE